MFGSVAPEANELQHPGGAFGVAVAERSGLHELSDFGEGLVEGAGRVVVRKATSVWHGAPILAPQRHRLR